MARENSWWKAWKTNGYIVTINSDDGRRGHINPNGVFVTDYTVVPNPPTFEVIFSTPEGNTSKSFLFEGEAEVFARSISPETGYGYPIPSPWIPEVDD